MLTFSYVFSPASRRVSTSLACRVGSYGWVALDWPAMGEVVPLAGCNWLNLLGVTGILPLLYDAFVQFLVSLGRLLAIMLIWSCFLDCAYVRLYDLYIVRYLSEIFEHLHEIQPLTCCRIFVWNAFQSLTCSYNFVHQNIVLSGGSTMFRDFGRRLQRDIKRAVDARLKLSEQLSAGRIKVRKNKFKIVIERNIIIPLLGILAHFTG